MSDWKKTEQEIEALFSHYSIHDIATSILCVSLWLPNLSSQMKNSYLTLFLLSRQPSIFQSDNKTKKYDDFRNFVTKLIELVPSFPTTEDYFPETDWGEIKFYFKDEIYRIFYGNEITDIYDYLSMFDIKYVSIDKQFREKVGRSPVNELRTCLSLQDKIITSLPRQEITSKKREQFSHGHFEVPSEEFWHAMLHIDFISCFKPLVSDDFLKSYSGNVGSAIFPNDIGAFIHGILYGLYSSCYFLENKGKHYLLNPRRFSCILLEKWFSLYQENKNNLFENKESKNFYPSYVLAKFINSRIITEHKFEIISATFSDGKPHQSMFASAILHENKVVLFYLLDEDGSGIDQEVSLVNEAIEYFKRKPYTLALHLDRQNAQFQSSEKIEALEPFVIYIYPNISIMGGVNFRSVPENIQGEFFDMTSFLGIFDETSSIADFLEFCDYIKNDASPIVATASLMDRYAAYKDSYKIISEGALNFDKIWLDPHWGSSYKYERLKEFWSIYPERNYFDHPRSWNPEVTGNRVRLVARGYRGCALFTKVSDANFFVTAPYNNMNLDEARVSDLQLMCLDDYIKNTADILQELEILKKYNDVNITFIPKTLIDRDDTLKHLKNEAKDFDLRKGSIGIIKGNVLVIRILFDVEKTIAKFLEPQNNSHEIDLISFVLSLFNRVHYDYNMETVIDKIKERYSDRKPRHTLMSIDTGVCFDELTPSAIVPDQHAFKAARKRVAEILRSLDIAPGNYALDDAKRIINLIRDKFVEEIDVYVLKYCFHENIKSLIKNIESLTHNAHGELALIEKTIEHEVDYDRTDKFNQVHTEFLSCHRDYRYIGEKFIQHGMKEGAVLKTLDIQYLLAFANELGHLYNISNAIHYGLYTVGINISDSFIFKAVDNETLDEKSKIYGKALSRDQIFNENYDDGVLDSEEERKNFQTSLDDVFFQEKGFKITNLIDVCVILSNYPTYDKNVNKDRCYIALKDEIISLCSVTLKDCSKEEIEKILDLLTLDKASMLTVLGDPNQAKDLPVWENNKRPQRYTVKPIIALDDKLLLWGPYSVKKAQTNWIKQLSSGTAPYDLENDVIEKKFFERKGSISKKVEDKSHEIVKRYTGSTEKNVFLHRRDRDGNHPSELGDYDVLAYIKDKNIVLNVECKDLLGAYCSKDAKRLRDKLFGEPKDKNYISKVIKRGDYLSQNLEKIFSVFSWKCDDFRQLNVRSLFVVRQLFWWHFFPEYETNVEFVKLSHLDEYLNDL
ncbi:MAG: hypothetical protein K8S27_02935 [Candidatus Omnitrophica bacterium]|nr:hypothetical protein [Candidatus Omnitrophota bacterium]